MHLPMCKTTGLEAAEYLSVGLRHVRGCHTQLLPGFRLLQALRGQPNTQSALAEMVITTVRSQKRQLCQQSDPSMKRFVLWNLTQ